MLRLLILICVSLCCFGVQAEEGAVYAPRQTAEEMKSFGMPAHVRCDACMAVVHQLHKKLDKLENLRGPNLRKEPLPEFEYMEALDEVCEKQFGQQSTDEIEGSSPYGMVRSADGKNMLLGPGLYTEYVADGTALMMGGGRWAGRLSMYCSKIIGDFTEEVVYQMFRQSNRSEYFAIELCLKASRACTQDEIAGHFKRKWKVEKEARRDASKREFLKSKAYKDHLKWKRTMSKKGAKLGEPPSQNGDANGNDGDADIDDDDDDDDKDEDDEDDEDGSL